MNVGMEMPVPLVNGIVNYFPFHSIPHISQTLLQLIHILHFIWWITAELCPRVRSHFIWWITAELCPRVRSQLDRGRAVWWPQIWNSQG